MKVIDKKGKIFEKISIIDLIIVGIIAAIGMFMYSYFSSGNMDVEINNNLTLIEYTVEFKEVKKPFTEIIKIGENVYNSSKNYYIGETYDFEVKPYTEITENYEDGTFELVEVDGLYYVYLTIKGYGTVTDEYIKINQQKIRVGEKIPVKGKGYAGYSYVVNVNIVGEE